MSDYREFLEKKKQFNVVAGFDVGDIDYGLFDFQQAIVKWACVAIQKGRRFVGAELKRSYWDLACRNLASSKSSQGILLDLSV